MTKHQIRLPEKLIPVFLGPADVRWACGGRGSAKTRSFAAMIAVRGRMYGEAGITGQLLCARQFMNSLDDSSLEECKRAIEDDEWLSEYYEIGDKYIRSRDGLIWFSFAGLDRNINSVKSKGRILICWVDEAEPVTEAAFQILEPTLREEGEGWNAELWVTWNPVRKTAPVETRYRNSQSPMVKGCVINWKDNPKFPDKLERQRVRDLEERPDQYSHIWDGEYATAIAGAYFAKDLVLANEQGRISKVSFDPMFRTKVFCDLGGTGAKADAFAMWPAQFIAREIRTRDHYEVQGQPLSAHVQYLRSKGYTPDNTDIWLPHDGDTNEKVIDTSFRKAFEDVGYTVEVVPNQGKGAAKQRVEAARRRFPMVWFDKDTTEGGRLALGWYHEKIDDIRGMGMGPEHDWSSHSSDAFGLMCVAYQEPNNWGTQTLKYPSLSYA
jgi:phage terminase large subunit